MQVEYNFVDDIDTDIRGNITADSINLEYCDYLLDMETYEDYLQETIPINYTYE